MLGDEGKLYVPDDLVAVYREDVVALATILTPNQFECELLSGLKVTTEPEALVACDALHARGPQLILLTSCSFGDSKALTVGHCRPFGQMHLYLARVLTAGGARAISRPAQHPTFAFRSGRCL